MHTVTIAQLQVNGKGTGGGIKKPINGRTEWITEGQEGDERAVAIRTNKVFDKDNKVTMERVIAEEDITLYRAFNGGPKSTVEALGAHGDPSTKRPERDQGYVYAQNANDYKLTFDPAPELLEFTTRKATAEDHLLQGGFLATVVINGKYLNGGSAMECGWVVYPSAPMRVTSVEEKK